MPLARNRILLRIFAASVVAGCGVGVLGSLFRLALDAVTRWREAFVASAHEAGLAGFLVVVAATVAATLAARALVLRFAPLAGGSGVQHVEAVMRGEASPAGFAVAPVKFVGGLLAIGAGLPLGREGPTVQMGAVLGHALGRRIADDPSERRAVFAAGAGAGLGVAFNTPIGAAVFVFEELTRAFLPRQVLAVLAAGAAAMAVMRMLLGDGLLFDAGAPGPQPLPQLAVHFALGAALGVAGVFYGRLTTACLDLADRLARRRPFLPAAIVGAGVGAVGWFFPHLIGGGETLVQEVLNASPGLAVLTAGLAVRLILCPVSYAAGVPGGLFAPLLVIGAAGGCLMGDLGAPVWGAAFPTHQTLAVVGMAAIFTGVVRAPLTGIVLAMEMTGRTDCVLPSIVACLAATLFATLFRGRPIYDVLRERMLAAGKAPT